MLKFFKAEIDVYDVGAKCTGVRVACEDNYEINSQDINHIKTLFEVKSVL